MDSTIHQANKDWLSGDAYIDNNGNYRLKSTSRIAPWNKLVKRLFKGVIEFHEQANITT